MLLRSRLSSASKLASWVGSGRCRLARPFCTTHCAPPAVAVVTPLDNPALRSLPIHCDAEFLLGENVQMLLEHGERLNQAEALLWVPPGDPAVLSELVRGGHMPQLKWAHGFYAGIDPIADCASCHHQT